MTDLLTRARRRTGRVLREWLPRNQHLRPSGLHWHGRTLPAEPTTGASYWPVVPAYTSELALPDDFLAAVSVYESAAHGKPRAQELMPEAFVLELRQGRIYADNWDSVAVIAADDRLVGDVSFQHQRQGWAMLGPEFNNIFAQTYFVPPVPVAGTVLSLLAGGGAAMGNYYHWLIDSLPRLHLVRAAGLLAAVDYVLVYDRRCRFVLDSLAGLGIGPERVIDVTTHRHLRAERLLVTTPVRGAGRHAPHWLRPFLQAAFLPLPGSVRRFGPRVFISRRDAQMRRLLNEAEAEAVLHPLGFETHALSDLTFLEKVSLFGGASAIVGTVGAGMANLVFAPQGAALLELHPRNFVEPESADTAFRGGLRYHWLPCEPSAESTSYAQARHLDLRVDVAELERLVRAML